MDSLTMSRLTAFLESERENFNPHKEKLELYAPRCPVMQLPDRYRVTPTNPRPPLLRFAFPIDPVDLYLYAVRHNLIKSFRLMPSFESTPSLFAATEHLSEHVEYQLELTWPFRWTADCQMILSLYTNYSMDEDMLVDEDQEDVIQMVQEALGFDKSVRPKWYFDFDDEWEPGDSDDETE